MPIPSSPNAVALYGNIAVEFATTSPQTIYEPGANSQNWSQTSPKYYWSTAFWGTYPGFDLAVFWNDVYIASYFGSGGYTVTTFTSGIYTYVRVNLQQTGTVGTTTAGGTQPVERYSYGIRRYYTQAGSSAPTSNVSLSQFYAGAPSGYVPNGTKGFPGGVSTNIPSSGPISFSNFHGASKPFSYSTTIALDVNKYNLYNELVAAGWNTTTPVAVTITINSGIFVYSDITSTAAFTASGLPSGSSLTITNNGIIVGRGGTGGAGGSVSGVSVGSGAAGGSGGTALSISGVPTTINNSSGFVYGGGGGGGGGGSTYIFVPAAGKSPSYTQGISGGGGGGGQGYLGGAISGNGTATGNNNNYTPTSNPTQGSYPAAGAGGPSRTVAPQTSGAGGSGGALGSPGNTGTGATGGGTNGAGGAAGAAGPAVTGNSNITWNSGGPGSGRVVGPVS